MLRVILLLCLLPSTIFAYDKRIVASIRPLQSIIANIVDNTIKIDLVVDRNESLHYYQLKPNKVISLSNSDYIIFIDRNFETFLNKAIDKYAGKAKLIEVSKLPGVKLLESDPEFAHSHDDEEHDHEGHSHSSSYDYHLWLDIDNAKAIARGLTKELSEKYPDLKEKFEANLNVFIAKLTELDSNIRAKLLLVKDKNFIVSHNAYTYYITRYGLSQPKALNLDHEHNIGARDMLTIQQSIDKNHVQCIFEEPQFNSQIFQKIRANSKVKLGKLDAEWGDDSVSVKDAYFAILENLTDSFSDCLK